MGGPSALGGCQLKSQPWRCRSCRPLRGQCAWLSVQMIRNAKRSASSWARPVAAASDEEGGRGLALVDALTNSQWGVSERQGVGKLVWAVVAQGDQVGPSSARRSMASPTRWADSGSPLPGCAGPSCWSYVVFAASGGCEVAVSLVAPCMGGQPGGWAFVAVPFARAVGAAVPPCLFVPRRPRWPVVPLQASSSSR